MLRDKPLGGAGGIIFALFLFCGVFADFLAPYGMNETDMRRVLESPS
ncbi:MAG TPA: ABC transporter permease, partial [Gammaproteobacteria bacterium]|nr:ABC transporter permease [Gammaproteobacteria bacterium]